MNPYLTKLSETNHGETNKAFAKTLAFGSAGTVAGGLAGHLLSTNETAKKIGSHVAEAGKAAGGVIKNTNLGGKAFRLADRIRGSRVGMAMAGAGGLGVLLGSHMGGAVGDYAAAHSIVNRGQEKKAEINKYLVKAAGMPPLKTMMDMGKHYAGPALGAAKSALKNPTVRGAAMGAGGVLAAVGAKKVLSSNN